jgi:hypothetical protein
VEGIVNKMNETLFMWETFPIVLPKITTGAAAARSTIAASSQSYILRSSIAGVVVANTKVGVVRFFLEQHTKMGK